MFEFSSFAFPALQFDIFSIAEILPALAKLADFSVDPSMVLEASMACTTLTFIIGLIKPCVSGVAVSLCSDRKGLSSHAITLRPTEIPTQVVMELYHVVPEGRATKALGDIAHANEDVSTKILQLKHTRDDANEAMFDAKEVLEKTFERIHVELVDEEGKTWAKKPGSPDPRGMMSVSHCNQEEMREAAKTTPRFPQQVVPVIPERTPPLADPTPFPRIATVAITVIKKRRRTSTLSQSFRGQVFFEKLMSESKKRIINLDIAALDIFGVRNPS